MRNLIIEKLTSCGFNVSNAGIIYKQSTKHNSKEKAGVLNDFSVYFYAQNVAPFNPGTNTFKDILGSNYIASDVGKVYHVDLANNTKKIQHNFTFEDYKKTTKTKNHFTTYLTNQNKDVSSIYDIRGVKTGYLENSTLFPYIDYHNEFQTAKIVKYNSVTGKRVKGTNNNNWFHAYKPIKNDLGLTDKISKKITCFFGEHLLVGNDKPVVIVEAEKTAVILSLIFKDIVFLATGGLNKLKTLDYSFLLSRKVFLYPDNNAKEWFDIGKKRNWYVSEILEKKGTPGSDAADYLDTEIGNDIAAELCNIEYNEIKNKVSGFNFSYKQKVKKGYCSTIYQNFELNYYIDSSKSGNFTGTHFRIYHDNFNLLTAGIDVNKWGFDSGKLIKPNADTLIERLEQSYRILKKLNSNKDVLSTFKKVLMHLLENSNYLFNIDYVIENLIPQWSNDSNDISEYIKTRNWRVISGNIKENEFITLLNNDKKSYQTNQLLLKLQPLLKEQKYIKLNDVGLTSKQSNEFIYNLIRDFNTKVLGCKTINNYNKKIKVNQYFDFVVSISNQLENTKTFKKFCTTYNSIYIDCKKSGTNLEIPSIQTIYDNTLIDKHTIREYLNFKPTGTALSNIKTIVEYYISNPNQLHFIRVDKRIQIKSNVSLKDMKESIKQTSKQTKTETTEVAFDYEINLNDSVLNVEQSVAMQKGNEFLYSWILFNTENLTEYDKFNIKINPLQYLLNVDVKKSA
jgi:hypothetical protein